MHVCCAQEAEQCAQQSILNTRRNFQYGLGNDQVQDGHDPQPLPILLS